MALLMRLIRQPIIIGYILTGVIVGPIALHLLKSTSTIDAFSNFGIALLLFIIGLGLKPVVIKEVGKVAALAGLIQVAIISGVGWLAGHYLGLGYRQSVFLGVALSFSSTIIILKLLSDKKELPRLYSKITISILIVQDVIAAIALLFVASQGHNSAISLSDLSWLALKGLAATAALFIVGTKILPKLQNFIAGSQETLFLFAIGWGFGCAALFQGIGFSLEVGALMGGIALASLPYTQEISSRLRPLRDFFIVLFFISLGSLITFGSIGSDLRLIIVSLIIVVILKPLIVLVTMGFMGYTKQTSFKTAISLGQISEFSLVLFLLGRSSGILSTSLVNSITVIAIVSIAISTYLINYSDQIYRYLERYLSVFEKRVTHPDRNSGRYSYELILFGYKKGGMEFIKLFQELDKKFVVIDYDPESIDTLEHQKINCIYGDATDIELLNEVNIEKVKLVVSTISDFDTNVFLIKLIEKINPKSIVIVHAESITKAKELYELGASYVVIPHYIGHEHIGSFIKKSDLKKAEFTKFHDKHMEYIKKHYAASEEVTDAAPAA